MPDSSARNPSATQVSTERLISQSAAARMLKTSRPTVVARIARGELEGERVSGELKVVRASVEAFLRRERKRAAAAAA